MGYLGRHRQIPLQNHNKEKDNEKELVNFLRLDIYIDGGPDQSGQQATFFSASFQTNLTDVLDSSNVLNS
jgi:hypothetical protein